MLTMPSRLAPSSRSRGLVHAIGSAAIGLAVLRLSGWALDHPDAYTAVEVAGRLGTVAVALVLLFVTGGSSLLQRGVGTARAIVAQGWPMLLACGVVAGLGLLSGGSGGPTVAVSLLWFSLSVALTALFEEILCRGVVQEGLLLGGYGIWATVIGSSVIFSVLHLSNLLDGRAGTTETMTQVFYTFCMGVLLAAIRLLTGSLWAGIALHGIFNFLGGLSIYLRGRPANPVVTQDLSIAAVVLLVVLSLPILVVGVRLVQRCITSSAPGTTSASKTVACPSVSPSSS